MVQVLYDFPLPNNGERYDLSHEELDNLLHKAYQNGWQYGYQIAQTKYDNSMTKVSVYPKNAPYVASSVPYTIERSSSTYISDRFNI